jgi:DNA-binding LacI/PurR family transcriptional regulator
VTQPAARSPRRGRPTLEDVAAHAQVSRALVSIVMRGAPGASETTRARVLQAAADLGYRPDTRARLLARTRSQLLGVMFNVRHAFHSDLVEGIYAAAEADGYDVVLSALTPSRDEARAEETLLGYRCDALLLLGPESPASPLADLARRLPVVVVGRRVSAEPVDSIHSADDEGLHQAVDHLVTLGHQEIVHIGGGRGPKAADRRRGYRTAMRQHDLGDHIRVLEGGQTTDAGARAARRLLRADTLPTAVVAYDDDCAVGALDTLVRAGVSVPRDISIVGYDDSLISRFPHVNLTTVGQDAHRMAGLAVRRALERLNGEEVAERELILSPHLIVRGTTDVPRGKAPARA